MKTYYFIAGLPRSGSTLLSSILNQNPNFYGDIASPLRIIIKNIIDIITSSENNFTINEEQRKDFLRSVFDGYYQNNKKSIIFDTSRGWTTDIPLLKSLFPNTKIICPVRDIVSILNSFEILFSKNPFYTKTLTNFNDNIFVRCDEMISKDGIIGKSLLSLEEGFSFCSEIIYFVEYENLCKEPEKTMKNIYKFLEEPYYSHCFDNIQYSNESFDIACNLKDLHAVKNKVEYNPPKFILPERILKEYGEMNMEFWRKNYNFVDKKNQSIQYY